MNKQKKGLVPELRFPEFKKEPNWPCVKLNAVAKRSTSKNKEEKITRVLTNSAVDGVVDQRDYFDKDIAVKGNLESYYIVDKGDYVYNPRISSTAPVGPISKNKVGEGVMSPLYTVFRFNSKENDFFEQFFKSSRWHGYLKTISNSGARHDRISITSSEFMAMPVPNPCELEQQKIADCLASIDELIILHTQKLNALKDHKKGLMLQLFPTENETVPKLRFSEFKGTWSLTDIGKAFSIFQGFAFSSKDATREGVRWLKIADVGIQHMNSSSPSYLPESFKTEYEKFRVKMGDYVVALTRPILGRNLKISKVDALYHGALLNQRVGKIVTENNRDFIFCMLQNDSLIRSIEKNIAGNDPPNLSSQQISSIPVRLPSIEEQEKIANFFMPLDVQIVTVTKKIELLKIHKSALMQKLFPVMDEID